MSIPYGMSARNFLRSAVYPTLRARFRLIVLTPLHADPAFRAEFSSEGVVLRDLPKRQSPVYKAVRLALDIAEGYDFTRRTRLETLEILERCLRDQKPLSYWPRVALGATLSRGPLLRALRGIHGALLRDPYYDALFAEFSPAAVFLTHPVAAEEYPLAFAARRAGARLGAMIHSWDNITSKSGLRTVTSNRPGRMLPLRFDKVVVWNPIMREQLVAHYGYAPDDVYVSGVPQFDAYVGPDDGVDRAGFLRGLGLDPEKKLVFYAAGSPVLLPRQEEVLDILAEAVRDGALGEPCQLLIRSHPRTDMSAFKRKFTRVPGIAFDEASAANAASRVTAGWSAEGDDADRLSSIIRCSDVTINVSSTMSLDAAVFDKPIVCVAFDGRSNAPYLRSLRKHYDFTHYKPIVESGGVRVALSPEEFLDSIRAYLKDPALDREGRRRIVEEQVVHLDGKTGERVGRFVAEFAGGGEG